MAEAAYLRLVSGNDRSGESDPQQRISKEGDELLRRLMVGCAHYILWALSQEIQTYGATVKE
jgi:transposase